MFVKYAADVSFIAKLELKVSVALSATNVLPPRTYALPFVVMETDETPSPTFSQKLWTALFPSPAWKFLPLFPLNTYVPDLSHSAPSS